MSRLRNKLASVGKGGALITLRGEGYVLEDNG